MKIRKYSLCLMLLILSGISGVFWIIESNVAIQNENETELKDIELEIWYPWTDKNELYEKAFLETVAEYNQTHSGVRLVPYGMEMELYREKLPADIASNDTPDIYYCFSGAYMEKIVRSGRILMLDDYLNGLISDTDKKEILSEMIFDDNLYGLGFARTAGMFLVNEEMFERYQLEIPETKEQLMTVCREFLNYGITPLACSEDADVGFRMYLEALCMSEAGAESCIDIMTGKEPVNDAFMTGIRQFLTLVDMGAFGTVPVQENTHEVEEDFLLSRIPMYYTKNSFIGTILQRNSPLYGKIRAVPFPGMGENVLMGGLCDGFVINAAAGYPEESTLALWELTQGFSEKLYASGAGVSVWRTADDVPESILQDEEGNRIYLDMMELIRSAEQYVPFWENAVDRERVKVYTEASRELFEQDINAEEFVELISGGG